MAKASLTPSKSAHVSPPIPLGGWRVAWIIALRQVTDDLTSLRFLIITLLVIGLTPLAVYVGGRDYSNRLQDYNRLVAERQELMAGPLGKRVSGYDYPWTPQNELAVLRALRPPEPLSVLVRGLDGGLPEYWDFSPTGIQVGPSASQPQRLADALGQLDLEFLIRVVLGLLAILLAFDAVAGEKEFGTLRVALSQPISRPAFLTGKLVGGAVTLLVPLTLAFLLALLSAQLFGISLLIADALAKVALLAATSGTYLLCFYALGLLISSLATRSKTSLVVLLVAWVVMVLAAPPLATLMAQAVSPVQPAHAVQTKKQALDEDIRRDAERAMGDVFREETGQDRMVSTGLYLQHKEAIDRRIAPIVVTYVNKRRQFLGNLERDSERQSARQNEVANAIMALSPAATFARASADLAGTGDAHHAAWLEAARRHQSQLDATLFDDPPTVEMRMRNMSMTLERRVPPSAADLPAFVPPRRDARAAVARALPALGLLLLYSGLLIAGGFVAFSRCDVR